MTEAWQVDTTDVPVDETPPSPVDTSFQDNLIKFFESLQDDADERDRKAQSQFTAMLVLLIVILVVVVIGFIVYIVRLNSLATLVTKAEVGQRSVKSLYGLLR